MIKIPCELHMIPLKINNFSQVKFVLNQHKQQVMELFLSINSDI